MKIIAKNDTGYVLIATASEVANLIGFYGEFSDGFRSLMQKGQLPNGTEIKVNAMYSRLEAWRRSGDEMAQVEKKLRDMADALSPLVPALELVEVPA